MKFKKAVKYESKLRMAISGPSGAGKTFTALSVATLFAQSENGRVAFIDTEKGSAAKYADYFDFDVIDLEPPYHPDRFVELINLAQADGYKVVVIDSLTHSYAGTGGLLELADMFGRTRYKGNSYAGWGDATPIHNAFLNAIVHSNIHVVATIRSKMEHIMVEKNGKQVPQKVGMNPIARDGTEYEFDLSLDMDLDHNAVVSKTRFIPLDGKVFTKPGKEFVDLLIDELKGVSNEEKQKRQQQTDFLANEKRKLKETVSQLSNFSASTPEEQAIIRSVLLKAFGEPNKSRIVSFVQEITGKRTAGELDSQEVDVLLDWLGANEANQYTPDKNKAELARQIAG